MIGVVATSIELRVAFQFEPIIDDPTVGEVETGQDLAAGESAAARWDARLREDRHLREPTGLLGQREFRSDIQIVAAAESCGGTTGHLRLFDEVCVAQPKLKPFGEESGAKKWFAERMRLRDRPFVVVAKVRVAGFDLHSAKSHEIAGFAEVGTIGDDLVLVFRVVIFFGGKRPAKQRLG